MYYGILFIGGVMAFDFYFAGATTQRIRDYIIGLNANVLKSYYTDKAAIEKFFVAKKNGWRGKLMIDNGEFSFHRHGGSIDIDEYIEWLNKYDSFIDYAIAVDSIPGKWRQPKTLNDYQISTQKTWENYLYMIKRVKSPNKLLPVFHQGDDFSALERFLLLPELKYICISGSKDLTNADREVFYERCFDIIDRLRPDIKVHCLGSATISNVEQFRFMSLDSTTCNMVAAMGNVFIEGQVIYVGDNLMTIKSKGPDYIDVLNRYCVAYGIDSDAIGSDYQSRCIFNIKYLFEKSHIVETRKTVVRRRKLF